MTDNEIIKALERISLYSGFTDDVSNTLLGALDLIKQQRENIERLQSMNRAKLDTVHDLQAEIDELKEKYVKNFERWELLDKRTKQFYAELYEDAKDVVKAESIKEFAERLKENISDHCHIVSDEGEYLGYDCDDVRHCIDDLVKEIVGEGNA